MPKPTKGARLGGGPAHERLLLANMAGQLFTHKSIKTTEVKAKRLRPVAERLVTFAKRGDLHSRRRVLSILRNKETTHILFSEVAPLLELREGGYTRITKLGFRKGDNASMVQIELVLEPVTPKTKKSSSSQKTAAAAAPATTEALLEEPAEELTTSDEAIIEATTEAPDAVDSAETTEADAEAAFADEAPADDAATDEAPADDAATDDKK